MATRFELVLCGDDPVRLRAAGEEALEEIERLDRQLSLFRSDSEISWINARASAEPVKVEPGLFCLLERAARLCQETDEAFDITVAPLMSAWGFRGEVGSLPDRKIIDAAMQLIGCGRVLLDPAERTVRFDRDGVRLDLGAIGKGYALECAVESLKENGIESGLIHGGTSTVYGIGLQPDGSIWRIGVRGIGEYICKMVELRDSALSVSAVRGRSYIMDGREYGHVIDPRSGEPVSNAVLAVVIGESATDCDALSTALLVSGAEWVPVLRDRFPGYDGWVLN